MNEYAKKMKIIMCRSNFSLVNNSDMTAKKVIKKAIIKS